MSREACLRADRDGAAVTPTFNRPASAAGRAVVESGDLSGRLFWAGIVQGLSHDISRCEVVIGRIIAVAEAIIFSRLGALARPPAMGAFA